MADTRLWQSARPARTERNLVAAWTLLGAMHIFRRMHTHRWCNHSKTGDETATDKRTTNTSELEKSDEALQAKVQCMRVHSTDSGICRVNFCVSSASGTHEKHGRVHGISSTCSHELRVYWHVKTSGRVRHVCGERSSSVSRGSDRESAQRCSGDSSASILVRACVVVRTKVRFQVKVPC